MAGIVESLNASYDGSADATAYRTAGEELLEVSTLLGSERTLRTTLADSSISADAKKGLLASLFGSLSAPATETLGKIVNSRWSSDSDLVDAVEQAGDILVLMGAEADGRSDQVEEELFRFGRAIDANPDLQMALTNPATPAEAKTGIVRSLLENKAEGETNLLVGHIAASLRGRRFQDAISSVSELAADRRGRVVAVVRSAVELNDDQQARLAGVLAKLHGRDIELNIEIDPTVIGGIEVRVGDEVIDGTSANRLEQARRRMAG